MADTHERDSAGRSRGVIASVALDSRVEALLTQEGRLTSAVALGRVVDARLEQVVAGLLGLGFEVNPNCRRKPRRLTRTHWAALQLAAKRTGVTAPLLLQACAQLEARARAGEP